MVLSEEAQSKEKAIIEKSIHATLTKINERLESHQVLDRVVIMSGEWSIENDLLTPTLKVKRHVLEKRFEPVIQAEYHQDVVWVDV